MFRRGSFFILLLLYLPGSLSAQEIKLSEGSVCEDPGRKPFLHNILQQAKTSILRNPEDTCSVDPEDQVLNARAEDIYMPFAGKIIREIQVSSLGFERNFSDTSSRIENLATRLADAFHSDTKDWVIRNNLFQKEGSYLDPFIMADNERYLRSLDFLQDARILVVAVPGSPDSVDLVVVTRDVFSIKPVLDNDGFNAARLRVSESNFLGMGQRIQGTIMYAPHRNPMYGFGFEYNKNNICGSFIHLNLAYNNIDQGPSLGFQPEQYMGIVLDRPLPSPYDYYAGAIKVSNNKAINVYGVPDSLWYNYAYNLYDFWAGYNLSLAHLMKHDSSVRDRKFLSLRYFRQEFVEAPALFEQKFDPVYNDKEAVLAQMTFFRQDFIKTQYIYGFGITEDVPYGYNISLTGGWWKQKDLARPYAGVSIDYYTAKARGSFCQYYLRAGGFLNNGENLDDAAFLIGLSWFSRLYFSESNLKIRQYVRGTYARIFNPLTYEPLRINNEFGIREFSTDSAEGFERLSVQTETIFFLRRKLLGFRMAPFAYLDAAMLRGSTSPLYNAQIYPSFGAGLRTRNEALIFGTIEFKACIFPRQVVGQPAFKFLIASDLRYKYRTTYVQAPDIIRLNSANP